MKRTIIYIVIIGFAALITRYVCIAVHHQHEEAAKRECINMLRAIDAAKQDWAIERIRETKHLKGYHDEELEEMVLKDPITNAVPTWKDVLPYMQGITEIWQNGGGPPKCPSGGTYNLRRVVDPPTCTVPGHVLD